MCGHHPHPPLSAHPSHPHQSISTINNLSFFKLRQKTNPKTDNILILSKRSYRLLLHVTSMITLIERKTFLLYLISELAALATEGFAAGLSTQPQLRAPPWERGMASFIFRGFFLLLKRKREDVAVQTTEGTWGIVRGRWRPAEMLPASPSPRGFPGPPLSYKKTSSR